MRRVTAVRLAVALAAAVLPLGTAAAATAPTHAFLRTGISFRYPSAWAASPAAWNSHPTTFTVPIAWISPQPLRNPCVTRGGTISCERPAVPVVRPGGVVVTVSEVEMPGLDIRRGSLILLGGRASYLLVKHPGTCTSVHADETVTASIPVTDDAGYILEACLRAPTTLNEGRVRALLETVRLH
jgi:hypothetical protein